MPSVAPEPVDASGEPAAPAQVPWRPWRNPRLVGTVAVLALLATLGAVRAAQATGPEEVVEEFFAAILDREVDRALSYVGRIGSGVPFGEGAVFLHPDAIADGWELRELRAGEPDPGGEVRVRVTLGDAQDSVVGYLEVTDFSGEWNLVDPFVTVAISAAPSAPSRSRTAARSPPATRMTGISAWAGTATGPTRTPRSLGRS